MVTLKLQDPWRVRPSVAVHVTTVEPGGNAVPEGLEQMTAIGGWPPNGSGVLNVIGTPAPSGEMAEMGGGHTSVGASGMGSGGVGELQALNTTRHNTTPMSLGTNPRKSTTRDPPGRYD